MSAILLLIGLFVAGHIEATATCNKRLDLAFVVDSSDSVCNGAWPCPKWDAIIQFCKDIVNSLTIGKYDTRVAFVTLSDYAYVEWNLGRYTDKTSVISAIDNVKYRGGELTSLLGLASISELLIGVFNPLLGDGLFIKNIAIVLTDGVPNFPSVAYAAESFAIQLLRQVGMFVVCAPPACTEECASGVASPPKVANKTYYLIDDYLEVDKVRDTLVKNFCAWPAI